MPFDPLKHHRRSIRLKGYDYSSPSEYYITICTKNRECVFGVIEGGKMILNDAGKIAEQCWLEIPDHYPGIELDVFVIMPNHIHGIIVIAFCNAEMSSVGAQDFEPLHDSPRYPENKFQKTIPRSIGSIVRGYKTGVTIWFRKNTDVYSVWQRNYYERIIRNDTELNNIREYIINNPANWKNDDNFSV